MNILFLLLVGIAVNTGSLFGSSLYTYDEWETNRIVGGQNAQHMAWPWMVMIDIHYPNDIDGCGGSIINKNWILTAAHCFSDNITNRFDNNIEKIVLKFGENDTDIEAATKFSINVFKDNVFMHLNYSDKTVINDIALIKLNKSLEFNKLTRLDVIHLPDKDFILNSKQDCVATGWGNLKYDGNSSKILQEVVLPIYDFENCSKLYDDSLDRKTQICAGYYDDERTNSTCKGDSGGPLNCKNDRGEWLIAGITSFGRYCGSTGIPSVFTKVSAFLDWINKEMHPKKINN
ncbi:chymotrypsin-C-like isoform X1 [Oppia nitens]|uniref:chymotrypsin-C-like isoform X1 n=1 Tax=Oppia nitens TaxID=1686743 RepID=UPI0023D9D098|nr:chymotrypsin-C-like isoform X1 [Oppia nitens]